VVAALGAISALLILENPEENIGIDTDNAEFNLDYDLLTGKLENGTYFILPLYVTNAGYFDLENLKIEIDIVVNYSHVDYPTPGVNGTKIVKIFYKLDPIGTIRKGETRDFNYTGAYSDFIVTDFPNKTDIDFLSPPWFEFYANLTISLDYSLGMHSLSVNIQNYKMGEYS